MYLLCGEVGFLIEHLVAGGFVVGCSMITRGTFREMPVWCAVLLVKLIALLVGDSVFALVLYYVYVGVKES
jgi:hypothetical protein